MAITKKAVEVRKLKSALRSEVAKLNEQLLRATCYVPKHVINGSHQIAVAWKELAESVALRPLSVGGESASVRALEELIEQKKADLSALTGVAQ